MRPTVNRTLDVVIANCAATLIFIVLMGLIYLAAGG